MAILNSRELEPAEGRVAATAKHPGNALLAKSGLQEDCGKAEFGGRLLQRSLVMGLIGLLVIENRRPVKLQTSKMREQPCRVLKQ